MEFDFATNTSVPTLDKVPQDFRGLYKQDGDKFVLDADNAAVKSAVSAITGLNNALKAARKEKAPTVDLAPLSEFGADPVAIKTKFNQTISDLTEQIKGVNIPKITEGIANEWKGKVDAAQTEGKALEGQLYEELVTSRATTAIAAEKGDVELLMPFVTKQVKTTRVNGKLAVQVVDGAGDVRFSGVTGQPMTVTELIKEMKGQERYGRLFNSESPRGGGSLPSTTSRGPLLPSGQHRDGAITTESSTSKIARALGQGLGQRRK